MRNLLFIFTVVILSLSKDVQSQTTYYMATDGNDANPGTIGSPKKTIESAIDLLSAGDILYIRGGTYTSVKANSAVNRFLIDNLNGSLGDSIFILNYPGEQPVFYLGDVYVAGSAGDGPTGLKVENCSYIHIRGIKIERLDQNPAGINTPCGVILYGTTNYVLEGMWVNDIEGYGFYFQNGSSNGKVINCDASKCIDLYTGLGGANGFNITGGDGSTNIYFYYCRAWEMSDDGFDNYSVPGVFYYIGCWAFRNGFYPGTNTTAGDGMGFKLGPSPEGNESNTLKYVYACLAAGNRLNGFDQNSQSNTTCRMVFYNNSAISNGSNGYFFGANLSTVQTFKNNLNYNNNIWGDEIQSGAQIADNSWNLGGVTINNSDFQSLDTSQLDGARDPVTFALPSITFGKLVSGSDCIDACGTDYGYGNDLGAFQYSATVPPVIPSGVKHYMRGKVYKIIAQ